MKYGNLQNYLDELKDRGYFYFDIHTNSHSKKYFIFASTLVGGKGNFIDAMYDSVTNEVIVTSSGV